jgi:hypothetical protein
MQSKKPVEIDRRLGVPGFGLRDRDRWPQIVVGVLAVRHDHVQSIYRAALKNRNQRFATAASPSLTLLAKHYALEK